MIKTFHETLESNGHIDIINLTELLQKRLNESGLTNGTATIFVPGSTAGITAIEYEPGLIQDFKNFFSELLPYHKEYRHHETWHDDNGSSHLQAALLGPSLTVPFTGGDLLLGTWQQPILVDFDTRARRRKLIIQISGE